MGKKTPVPHMSADRLDQWKADPWHTPLSALEVMSDTFIDHLLAQEDFEKLLKQVNRQVKANRRE